MKNERDRKHHVVIIGGGFGGLNAARALMHSPVRVTLLDKRNFHLFQPLLYQVATGSLSPGDIAYPLRWIVAKAENVEVLTAEVLDILPDQKRVILKDSELSYDSLIVATGSTPHFFGHSDWEEILPGLKTVEDALAIRQKILFAFEAAEREQDPAKQSAWLHFVILGGGATGVELARAIAELARETMKGEFRHIDPSRARITLLEATDHILSSYPKDLSDEAARALNRKGVNVRTNTSFIDASNGRITIFDSAKNRQEQFPANTVLWTAGIQASPLGAALARRTGATLDRLGRIIVAPDLTIPGYPDLLVIGDLAHYSYQMKSPLPAVAQVAAQQGKHAARTLLAHLQGRNLPAFKYKDKGSMAVIGRNAAIADLGTLHLNGIAGWLVWALIHIGFLISFDNKLLVLIQWAWYYFTGKRGARLITCNDPHLRRTSQTNLITAEINQPGANWLPYELVQNNRLTGNANSEEALMHQ